MATTTVSVSFANGFVGNAARTTEADQAYYLTNLGWRNVQFQQSTDNGLFGGSQGNDYSGTILITDAAGVQHRIDGVVNWRAPSGNVSTMVFYSTGAGHTLATTSNGPYYIDPWTEANSDPHSFIGLTFNGRNLTISGGSVTGNAATTGLFTDLNAYLAAQPQLRVGDAVVNETAGTATFTVTLSKTSTDTVTVKYATADGTAVANSDYNATSGTLTFAPGQTSKTITVSILDNAVLDGTRTANIVLSDSTYAAITDNTGVLTINDNEVPASVATVVAEDSVHTGANPTDSAVDEGGTFLYTVVLSGTGGEYALTVTGSAAPADLGTLTFSDGVAWKNGNPATGIVVVPNGVGSFKVTLPTVDDTTIETTETAVLTVGGVAATGTIADNDSQAVTAVTAEDAAHTGMVPADDSVVEGGALLYTVTLNGASPVPTEYAVALSGTAGGADLATLAFSNGVVWKNGDANTGIVVVPAGVTSFRATLTTADDTAIESTETAVLTVGGVAATGTITDNDSQAVVSVIAEDAAHAGALPVDSAVVEGAALLYTVALNGPSPVPVEYTLTVGGTVDAGDVGTLAFSDGVAWKNSDPGTGIVVVPAGVTGFTITLPTQDDQLIETAESAVVTVGGVAATGTVADNDSRSIAAVVAEDDAHPGAQPQDNAVVEGGALRYTVSLSMAGVAATEFALAATGTASAADLGALTFSDGVAWKNGDPNTGIVVVPGGITGFRITVATNDDAAIEVAETLVLTVGGIAATGTITDNDVPAVASVKAADAQQPNSGVTTVTEGARCCTRWRWTRPALRRSSSRWPWPAPQLPRTWAPSVSATAWRGRTAIRPPASSWCRPVSPRSPSPSPRSTTRWSKAPRASCWPSAA